MPVKSVIVKTSARVMIIVAGVDKNAGVAKKTVITLCLKK